MRTIALSLVQGAAHDAADWQTLAASIAADERSAGWPPIIVRDLFRIAHAGPASAIDATKVRTSLARLELPNA